MTKWWSFTPIDHSIVTDYPGARSGGNPSVATGTPAETYATNPNDEAGSRYFSTDRYAGTATSATLLVARCRRTRE